MQGHTYADTTQSATDTERTRPARQRVTDKLVRSAEAPPRGNRILYDSTLPGFGLRVTAAGKKAFVLNYRFKGRERRITIGSFPEWTVLAAKKRAEEFRLQISQGTDPLEVRQSQYSAPTMRDLFERYDREYVPKLAARTAADNRSMFQKIILPKLGAKKVEDVTFLDCEALHRAVSADRPVRANRVHEVLRRALNLAIKWGWIERNPAAGVERNTEQKRQRYLSPEEVTRLLAALDAHPQRTSCDAITFMLLTGCRRGEALGARWDQFDPSLRIWTKTAATTKQRRDHRVPVSSLVMELLNSRQATAALLAADHPAANSPFLFPSTEGLSLADAKRTWAAVTKKAGLVGTRMHDLRHTFASVLVSNGQTLPVIGALLGHTQPQTTARYAHLFDDSLLAAAEAVGSVMTAG